MAKLNFDMDKVRASHGDEFADWLIVVQEAIDEIVMNITIDEMLYGQSGKAVQAINRQPNFVNTQPPSGGGNKVVRRQPDIGSEWKHLLHGGICRVFALNIPHDPSKQTTVHVTLDDGTSATYDLDAFSVNFVEVKPAPKTQPQYVQTPSIGERWNCPASPKRSGIVIDVKTVAFPHGNEVHVTIDHDIPGQTTYSLAQLHAHFYKEQKPQLQVPTPSGQSFADKFSTISGIEDNFDPGLEIIEKKCECGTDKAGGGIHSSWCPKG